MHGSLAASDLERLQDRLFDDRGQVDFEVRGGHDAHSRPILTVLVRGVLRLRCQRCLECLEYPVSLDSTLLLQAPEDVFADDGDDGSECIEPDPQLDVAVLVEDELILGLPYAPLHAEGLCQAVVGTATPAAFGSALAGLARLKQEQERD